jgi:hypothetical protein
VTGHLPHGHEPGLYELRVEGHLDDHWVEWFDHLELTRASDGTTALRGPVADQAALHSLLNKLHDLGIVLISVRIIGPPAGLPGDR